MDLEECGRGLFDVIFRYSYGRVEENQTEIMDTLDGIPVEIYTGPLLNTSLVVTVAPTFLVTKYDSR